MKKERRFDDCTDDDSGELPSFNVLGHFLRSLANQPNHRKALSRVAEANNMSVSDLLGRIKSERDRSNGGDNIG